MFVKRCLFSTLLWETKVSMTTNRKRLGDYFINTALRCQKRICLSEREPLNVATFLRKSYTLREQILEEQPAEKYHIAQKKGLKIPQNIY